MRENCQKQIKKHRKGYVIKIESGAVKSILIEVRFGLSVTTSSRQPREMRYSKHRNNRYSLCWSKIDVGYVYYV